MLRICYYLPPRDIVLKNIFCIFMLSYMKLKSYTWLLFLCLLVLPMGAAWACGNASKKDATEKMSCSKEDSSQKATSCCASGDTDSKRCDGNCGHASCHCPVSVHTTVAFYVPSWYVSHSQTYVQREWNYVSNIPKSIYFSIWQPPKIG